MLSSSSDTERHTAFASLERLMQSTGFDWRDIGNLIEHAGGDGKYTEAEMQEFGQAARAEGVEAGIKIGQARASKGGGNGHLTLPPPHQMAEYCHARLKQLDAKQRDFINDMYLITQRSRTLSPRRLAYLTSIYIQNGGRT